MHHYLRFLLLFFFMNVAHAVYSQTVDTDLVEDEEDIRRNAVFIRVLNFTQNTISLNYERYINQKWSIVFNAEYGKGPYLFESFLETNIRNSLKARAVDLKFESIGMVPEVRKYLGKKNQTSIKGLFLGFYFPIRRVSVQLDMRTVESFAYARQSDWGKFDFKGFYYGSGLCAGYHWISGNFSFQLSGGMSVNRAIGVKESINYYRPGIGSYKVEKDMGILGRITTFAPRLTLGMGVAF